MANNIAAGLNFVTASQSAEWEAVFSISDTSEVYATVNGAPVSWRPNKAINTLTDGGIVAGKGYLINSKAARDLTAFFNLTFGVPVVSSSIFNY